MGVGVGVGVACMKEFGTKASVLFDGWADNGQPTGQTNTTDNTDP